MLCDEFALSQTFAQLPHQDQAAIRSNPRSLEIDLQRGVERELKGLGVFLPPRRGNLQSRSIAFKPT